MFLLLLKKMTSLLALCGIYFQRWEEWYALMKRTKWWFLNAYQMKVKSILFWVFLRCVSKKLKVLLFFQLVLMMYSIIFKMCNASVYTSKQWIDRLWVCHLMHLFFISQKWESTLLDVIWLEVFRDCFELLPIKVYSCSK